MLHIPLDTYLPEHRKKIDALYQALKDMMAGGMLPQGSKLPSSRELAAQYGLSRGTVNQAYDMLAADGYVTTETGRGTFVAYLHGNGGAAAAPSRNIPVSAWGKRVGQAPLRSETLTKTFAFDFYFSSVDMSRFPFAEWNRCLYAEARRASGEPDYSLEPAQGDIGLRRCLAHYLRRTRGITADPHNIVIVNGSMQAIALLAQLILNEGDEAVTEQPGYSGIGKAIHAAGGVCVYAPVDERGIVPAAWTAKLLFATPSRQFPTGAVLSLERRRQLLGWARESGALIVEDDYDSEFRHQGRPLEPLKALDDEERVVYIGSFSKSMPAFLRIGYAVLPEGLVQPFCKAKELYEPLPTGLLEQRALAAFMQSGQYERHLRRMKRVYSRKFRYLQNRLNDRLADRFDWTVGDAGLHIFGWWKGDAESYEAFRAACGRRGVRWSETVADSGPTVKYGAYFNFSGLTAEQLERGVRELEEAADELFGASGASAASEGRHARN